MRRFALIIPLALLLAGCGGGGGSSTPSPFQGTWNGQWADAFGGQGVMSLTVNAAGRSTGSIYDQAREAVGTTSGTINRGGDAVFSVQFPGTAAAQIDGQVAITNQGILEGNLVIRSSQGPVALVAELIRQ